MKIHIIGVSGSGKSYFANLLSQKYNIFHYDLDDIFWDNSESYGNKNSLEDRQRKLKDILKSESWILEGVYYSWLEESFQTADHIYLLEPGLFLCKFRVIKRFLKRRLGLESGKKETFHDLIALLRWMDTFQSKNLPEIKRLLLPYEEKVCCITCRKYIANMELSRQSDNS